MIYITSLYQKLMYNTLYFVFLEFPKLKDLKEKN